MKELTYEIVKYNRIFRTMSRDFFQKFQGSGYSGATYVGRFQKPRTTHCALRRAWIST